MNHFDNTLREELQALRNNGNFRSLPRVRHNGRTIVANGNEMLDLSSNDYLGVANNLPLRESFVRLLTADNFIPSASSSRLLTGTFAIHRELEEQLAALFGTEAALVLSSGYHANTGILPAISNSQTLILADKLVHASLIDGMRLSAARCIRYRHNDMEQLSRLVDENCDRYERVIIATESIFSMDGDEADLPGLVRLKRNHPNLLLYVDEAHAFGVRGETGLGCAEEQHCIRDIDFLVGTFGKSAASVGAFVACNTLAKELLVNRMRTFIFTTALPPVNIKWTSFVLESLANFQEERKHLQRISRMVQTALRRKYSCPSTSHIVPLVIGQSTDTLRAAAALQQKGFYVLPVRPPSVPEGTSRIRLSLTANITTEEMKQLIEAIDSL